MENAKIGMTEFAKRHFPNPMYNGPEFNGTKINDMSVSAFMKKINHIVNYSECAWHNSPMDFCRYIVVDNFTYTKPGNVTITNENHQYLRSGYLKRTDKELAVLTRWFEFPVELPRAKHLQIVLYSRGQLEKEATERNEPFEKDWSEWNIVAILAQDTTDIQPMSPITLFRNALGAKYGGNSAELSIEEYEKSVAFWDKNANVK